MPNTKPNKEAEAFGRRLAALLARHGQPRRGAGAYLAKRYKVSNVVANAWLNGEYKPEIPKAKEIADDHNEAFGALYFGEGSRESDAIDGRRGPNRIVATRETDGSYVRVDQLDAEGDMGDGRLNEDYPDVIRSVEYTETFIRGLIGFLPPPGRLKLFTGRGDSMSPVIQPGEAVLVDTGIQSFDGDGIYLINTGGGQQIKALQHRGDAVYVVSANPLYPAFPFPAAGVVGGKLYIKNKIERFN